MRILVVTGQSGGHIFPALSFLDVLNHRYKDIDTLLILPLQKNQSRQPIGDIFGKNLASCKKSPDYRVSYLAISPIELSLSFKNFIAILKFFKGSLKSIIIFLTFKPDIVVGFGTLVCIPAIVFARLFGIKTVIHEQNVIPGKANRFLAKFSHRIAISFKETKDYLKGYETKVVLTGNPLRKELEQIDKKEALIFFGFQDDKFTILIMGGSQGSRRINLGFLRAMSNISDKFKFQIIHLAGHLDYDLLKESYRGLNTDIQLFRFLKPMQYAYSACDLVVSRGGASTIAEIIFFKLPAIIIPYPFAYKHQTANAKVLEKMGSAIIINDNELDKDTFKVNLEKLLNNPERIKAMRLCYDSVSRVNINDLLVNAVLSS